MINVTFQQIILFFFSGVLSVGGVFVGIVAYFLKKEHAYITNKADHKDINAARAETVKDNVVAGSKLREWVCVQLAELRKGLEEKIEKVKEVVTIIRIAWQKIELQLEKINEEIEEIKQENKIIRSEIRVVENKLDKIAENLSHYRDTKHDLASALNVKNMEAELAFKQLETSQKTLQETNILLRKIAEKA